MSLKSNPLRLAALAACLGALGACATVSGAVEEPQLTPITNPERIIGAIPISAPTPPQVQDDGAMNSLWRTGATGFFNDHRANTIGDILTVDIDITDTATLNNSTSTSRTGSQDAAVTGLFGLEGPVERFLPGSNSLDTGLGTSSSRSAAGTGSVNRSENIQMSVAAVITNVLPNGNFVIAGSQEVRVNAEVRELVISGVIRPQDISATNTIQHTQIAEARISYGGRGDLTSVQRAPYGQRIANSVLPF
ncbi:flagellar basal body L-ring protein FlgH [Ponticaulis sp.]|uniref:flagellar basal body L-ring protein FlgH n=1 Tax=Ponticaulis sp. TaxID=2020902 RepID=UPI000B6E362E|nr:flagellar basal body L-ring protein FlgH [Ponticaulis sp.]MAI89017.1 flagellar basal body L-ring protein [Ponticaulis sp.]OUY01699.1 MAG: flagellar basal body L-ring protein [Hyphomonadaceae bacterium TMED5]|tara:strand:- start:28400 stop:29146 length:747 start_codon:yes stop_codon:yes gene_type:complete